MQTHITDDVSQLRPFAVSAEHAGWACMYCLSVSPSALNWYFTSCSINSFAWHCMLVPAVYTFACLNLECMLFD